MFAIAQSEGHASLSRSLQFLLACRLLKICGAKTDEIGSRRELVLCRIDTDLSRHSIPSGSLDISKYIVEYAPNRADCLSFLHQLATVPSFH